MRVIVTDFWTSEPDLEREALGDLAELHCLGATDELQLRGQIEQADALLVWHDIRLGAASIASLERCRAIVRIGVGFDNVDLDAARRAEIPVCNVPDYGVEEVADHALAMLLALVRRLPDWQTALRGQAPRWDALCFPRLPRLRGKVLGIIGLGRIGTAMAMRGKALGMQVCFYDPYTADGRDKALGLERVESLQALLGRSFAVSIHTPLTDETRGMIDAQSLALLPAGATLINTARGPICDTRAILAALQTGQLAGVGLDVLPCEPADPEDPLVCAFRQPEHPAYHRIILTPHSAFYSEAGFAEMRRKAALEVRRALLGETLRNRVV